LRLNTPAESPIEATMTSVEPRVHGAGERQRFLAVEATELAADESTGKFADAGDDDEAGAEQQQIGILQDGQVGAQAREPKENRHEQRRDQAAQLLVDMAGEDRRFADQDAGDEGAKHRLHADQIGDQRHRDHDQQDHGDDRVFAGEIIIGPADQAGDDAPADREADGQEHQRAEDGEAHRPQIDRAR
jgi:hypothetical protein